ncbi:MAG: hypothetical protein R2867_24445 [Caldilineaceae bacterium]
MAQQIKYGLAQAEIKAAYKVSREDILAEVEAHGDRAVRALHTFRQLVAGKLSTPPLHRSSRSCGKLAAAGP